MSDTQESWDKLPLPSLIEDLGSGGPKRRRYCAARCKTAIIRAFGKREDPESGVIDILTDIRHLCDQVGLDFANLDRIAYNHYIAEKA